jgi:hypothetical protein
MKMNRMEERIFAAQIFTAFTSPAEAVRAAIVADAKYRGRK